MGTSGELEGSDTTAPRAAAAEPTGVAAEPTEVADGSVEPASEAEHEPMAKVRPGAPTPALLARARVLGAMFGDASAAGSVGRFRVLGRLGAGGMGVVYEAYDPDLARGVALKLVNVAAKDRGTALAEAKALARLSHPNVVPIYDVGLERDRVYLVMELVRGKTLRDWVVHRTPREILDVYQQAGRALAAAHAAGLVHRDFKPDNALVGADGRVRVVDFGLACEADDPARETPERRVAAGTPRFMAPEIKAGAAVTPSADQYSFCVALAEALAGVAEPVPRRVTAILERGRAEHSAQRFPSMAELLRALARDPGRTRKRVAASAGVAAVVGAIAFLVGSQRAGEADVCDDRAAQLTASWSAPERRAALARVSTLGAYGATLHPTLERGLDAFARDWSREAIAACRDRRRGAETTAMSDRRTVCLEAGRRAIAEVHALISGAVAADLSMLPRAVQTMPDPATCSDLASLATDVPPPAPALALLLPPVRDQITQARVQVGAGRYSEALAIARAAVTSARVLGYGPVLADALLVEGHAQLSLDRRAAVPVLDEAIRVGNASRARAIAIEAWARRAYALGTWNDPVGATAGVEFVESTAEGTPSAAFAVALLHNNLGAVALAQEQRAQARGYFARALVESRKVTGRGALELVAILANLALVTDDKAQGDKLAAMAVEQLTDRLGPDHPDTLTASLQQAIVTLEDLRVVEQRLPPVCRGHELHVSLKFQAIECWTELGFVRLDLGNRSGAIEALARAAEISSGATEASAYLALLRGDAHRAARQLIDAIAAKPPAPGESWWARLKRGKLELGLGRACRASGDLAGARAALRSAIADLDATVRQHPAASFERRLGRSNVELAFTLVAMNSDVTERTIPVTAGATWLRRVGGAPSELAMLEAASKLEQH